MNVVPVSVIDDDRCGGTVTPPVDAAHGPAKAVRLAKPKASRVPVSTISPECFQLNCAALRNGLTPVSTRSRWAARQSDRKLVAGGLAVTPEAPGKLNGLQFRRECPVRC